MKKFDEIVSKGLVFDASGIENPREYMWKKINGVYYPEKTKVLVFTIKQKR